MEEKIDNIIQLIGTGNFEGAILEIDSILNNKEIEVIWKVVAATAFLDIAEHLKYNKPENALVLITKFLQVLKKYQSSFSDEFYIKNNIARAYGLKYDINYINYQIELKNSVLDYLNLKSIYDIENYLTDSIKLYRESIKLITSFENNEYELYNIQNNLAQHLTRAGRFIEAFNLFENNIKLAPQRWQSFANYGDMLTNFYEVCMLPSTASLHLNIFESYTKAIENNDTIIGRESIKWNCEIQKLIIQKHGYIPDKETIKRNRDEEKQEFEKLNTYRKYVLSNSLSLNEHSIYCKCKDSKIDDLKIGLSTGSTHLHLGNSFKILDGLVNRIISEFSYSRFLYYNHISGISTSPDDVEFSEISKDDDELGYSIEQIRSSYRLIYSVLDKIMNGIMLLYNINRNKNDYFENFFYKRRNELIEKNNIHLASLFSLSIELNQENGSFKHFKEIRNKMEHDYFPINNKNEHAISLDEIEHFTFELLKLTRNAIFSFVFLIRTETILKEK